MPLAIYRLLSAARYDLSKSTKECGDAAMLMFGIVGSVLCTLFFGALFTSDRMERG